MSMQRVIPTIAQLQEHWVEDEIRYVLFELPDMHGMPRSKIVPMGFWPRFASEGLRMIGVMVTADTGTNLVPGTLYSEERSYGDAILWPDLETAGVARWLEATARVICDVSWPDGSPQEAAPRYVLRRVLERLAAHGYTLNCAFEFEFYLLQSAASKEPVFERLHIFHTPRNIACPVPLEIVEQLERQGFDVLTCNCEYGQGQYEITYGPQEGLKAADDAYTFKQVVKDVARQHGYHATFMTKPFPEESASGAHIHFSLLDERDENVFLDNSDPQGHGLSRTAYHFIAGLLKHAPATMALLAPTPNCYRRYQHHSFAPVNIGWGLDDRTAFVRAKNTGDANTHLEHRAPSGLCNPYLALAAILAAGLLGIEEEAQPPALAHGPAEEHEEFPPLPASLDEALVAFERDLALRELLGVQFSEIFLKIKRQELERRSEYVQQHALAAELAWEEREYLLDF